MQKKISTVYFVAEAFVAYQISCFLSQTNVINIYIFNSKIIKAISLLTLKHWTECKNSNFTPLRHRSMGIVNIWWNFFHWWSLNVSETVKIKHNICYFVWEWWVHSLYLISGSRQMVTSTNTNASYSSFWLCGCGCWVSCNQLEVGELGILTLFNLLARVNHFTKTNIYILYFYLHLIYSIIDFSSSNNQIFCAMFGYKNILIVFEYYRTFAWPNGSKWLVVLLIESRAHTHIHVHPFKNLQTMPVLSSTPTQVNQKQLG